MKKILVLIVAFFMLIPNTYASTSSAASYILMDASSGRVLLGKDINNLRLNR